MVQVIIIIVGLFLIFKPGSISLSAQRELAGKRKIVAGVGTVIIGGLISVLQGGIMFEVAPFIALLILMVALSVPKVSQVAQTSSTTDKVVTIVGRLLLAILLIGVLWLAYMVSMGK